MPRIRIISTEQLKIDPDVQLAFAYSESRARAMGAAWNPELVGVLVVVPDSNGGYSIVDGRHRFRGGMVAGIRAWRCDVHEDVAYEDAEAKAALKLGFDFHRRHVGALEHFIVRVMAHDRVAVDMNNTIRECGFEVGKSNPKEPTRLAAVSALEGYYRVLGPDGFRRMMQLATHWRNDPMSNHKDWIGALGLIIRDKYDEGITPTQLSKLRQVVPAEAIRHARGEVIRKGLAGGQGGGKGSWGALSYEVASYVRKKAGMRQRPVVPTTRKDSRSRPI